MSVTVAFTVTLPNTTAAKIAATGTDFSLTVGPEVIRRTLAQCASGSDQELAGATVATVVT